MSSPSYDPFNNTVNCYCPKSKQFELEVIRANWLGKGLGVNEVSQWLVQVRCKSCGWQSKGQMFPGPRP